MNPFQLLKESQQLKSTLVKVRRHIHAHAETGFELSQTLSYVKQQLIAMVININFKNFIITFSDSSDFTIKKKNAHLQ